MEPHRGGIYIYNIAPMELNEILSITVSTKIAP